LLWADIAWSEVAALPLCLLTPDMHNRTVIDEAFAAVQREVQPAMETNSVLSLVMAVAEHPGDGGAMVTVLPGAMVATVRHMPGLIARPLRSPELVTPIGFMTQQGMAPTRALLAALELQDDAEWRVQCLRHAGALKDWAVRRAGLACPQGRGVQHGAHRIGRERARHRTAGPWHRTGHWPGRRAWHRGRFACAHGGSSWRGISTTSMGGRSRKPMMG
jgi:hypothetical protein